MNSPNLLTTGTEQDFHLKVVAIQAGKKVQQSDVGTDGLPKNETIRFSVPQHLGFPGSAMASLTEPTSEREFYELAVNFMGLTGPSGVMPRHFSEWVIERCKQKDPVMKEFLDLFNHRLISLYHRAWEKYRAPLQMKKLLEGEHDPITSVLSSLAGVYDDRQLFASGLFSQHQRSKQGLKQVLGVAGGCKVLINERIGQWLHIDPNEQTCLSSRHRREGQFARLGESSILGQKVWDVESTVEIELYPQDKDTLQKLLPGSKSLKALKQIASDYLPSHVIARWVIVTKPAYMPGFLLGKQGLGLGQGSTLVVSKDKMQQQNRIPIS